jgi:hypothetical protein
MLEKIKLTWIAICTFAVVFGIFVLFTVTETKAYSLMECYDEPTNDSYICVQLPKIRVGTAIPGAIRSHPEVLDAYVLNEEYFTIVTIYKVDESEQAEEFLDKLEIVFQRLSEYHLSTEPLLRSLPFSCIYDQGTGNGVGIYYNSNQGGLVTVSNDPRCP